MSPDVSVRSSLLAQRGAPDLHRPAPVFLCYSRGIPLSGSALCRACTACGRHSGMEALFEAAATCGDLSTGIGHASRRRPLRQGHVGVAPSAGRIQT